MKKTFALLLTAVLLFSACHEAEQSTGAPLRQPEPAEASEVLPLETNESSEGVSAVVIGNPTPDDFKGEDFFVYLDLVCINAASIDWVGDLPLTEGEFLGEIKRTGVKSDFAEWDATVLSIGTKIYRHSENGVILVAVYGETKILYMKMVEG